MSDQENSQNTETAPVNGGNMGSENQPISESHGGETPSWLPARLERAKQSAIRELLEQLGVSDPDVLKQQLQELSEIKQAQMTEKERLQAQLEEAQRQAREAEEHSRQTLIRAAVMAAAGKLRAQYPEDAFALIDRSAVTINENGVVEGADEAVKALIDSGRLPIAGRGPAPNLDAGAGTASRPDGEMALTDEELILAQKMGLTPEQYLKAKIKK